jgi:hypothetical protein
MRVSLDPTQPDSADYRISFEEYKLLLDWTNRLADRRQATSNLFLGVSTALFAAAAVIFVQPGVSDRGIGLILCGFTGGVICVVWSFLLHRYQQLLGFKYAHLELFEDLLGLASCGLITAEDRYFRHGESLTAPGGAVKLVSDSGIRRFGITLAERVLTIVLLLAFFAMAIEGIALLLL